MKRIIAILTILTTFVVFYSQSSVLAVNSTQSYNQSALKENVINVPAGETFKAVITTPVSSDNASIGQSVTMVLTNDFYYHNRIVAPKGSSVTGSVIEVAHAKHGSIQGKLTLRFTQIITPFGLNIPISAIVNTKDKSGTLIGNDEVPSDSAKSIAYSGTILGIQTKPVSSSGINRESGMTREVGTGGGLVKSIWDKGEDVNIPVNTSMELLLTQPITVNMGNAEMNISD